MSAATAQVPDLADSFSGLSSQSDSSSSTMRTSAFEHMLAELALGSIGRAPTEGGGVKLATLHRTKGLQWKTVFLLGLEDGHIPDFRSESPIEIAEERRLCFVGVSRAQHELVVTRCSVTGNHTRLPSIFVKEMGLS